MVVMLKAQQGVKESDYGEYGETSGEDRYCHDF